MPRTALFLIIIFSAFRLQAGERSPVASAENDSSNSSNVVIGDIRIIRHDVFDTLKNHLRWFQELTNKLHIRSRQSIIDRELLFHSGDKFQRELLEESERNLRKLNFLGKVSIAADEFEQHRKDVTVITQDQWSTLAEISAGREGGRNKYRFGVAERNFLGNGQNISIKYKVLDTGNFASVQFDEPRLFHSRWALHLEKVQGEDRNFFIGEVMRPLYSLDARWSAGYEFTHGSAKSRWYEGGIDVDAFRSSGTNVETFVLRSFGSRYRKTNLKFGYGYVKANYSPYSFTRDHRLVTPDDEYHKIGIGLERDHFFFVKERHLDRFRRIEDIKIGSRWYGDIYAARRVSMSKRLRRKDFYLIELGHDRSFVLPGPQYFLGAGSIFSRIESGIWRHTITRMDVKYYNKCFPRQTIAGHVELLHGNNLDQGWQYIMGEDEGLRGYPSFRFSGQKFLMVNLEDRIFTPWEVLWTGIGAAVFVDGGYAWKSEEAIRLRDMRWSAGIGMRLGLNKSSGFRVIRLDLARAFDGSGFLFSVSSDHTFLVDRLRGKFLFPGGVF